MEVLLNNINLERNMVSMVIRYPVWFPCYPKHPISSEGTANTVGKEFPFSIDTVATGKKGKFST